MNLCQYQNVFGEPGTGAHKTRFIGFAVVDLFLTIFIAIVFARLNNISSLKTIGAFMIFATFLHWLFCVPTTITNALGLV